MLGVVAYWFINGLVVFFEPKHRSIIDFIMGTKVVTYDPSAIVPQSEPVKQTIKPKPQQPVKIK